jgi:hypothetical protein
LFGPRKKRREPIPGGSKRDILSRMVFSRPERPHATPLASRLRSARFGAAHLSSRARPFAEWVARGDRNAFFDATREAKRTRS